MIKKNILFEYHLLCQRRSRIHKQVVCKKLESEIRIIRDITDSFLSQQLSAVSSEGRFHCLAFLQVRNFRYTIMNCIHFMKWAFHLFSGAVTAKWGTFNIHVETETACFSSTWIAWDSVSPYLKVITVPWWVVWTWG